MKVMHCPMNGPRNISEFVYGGEVRPLPAVHTCSDTEWAEYVFFHNNGVEWVREWWLHLPSGYWFIAERHRGSDNILRTFDPAEIFKQRVEFSSQKVEEKA